MEQDYTLKNYWRTLATIRESQIRFNELEAFLSGAQTKAKVTAENRSVYCCGRSNGFDVAIKFTSVDRIAKGFSGEQKEFIDIHITAIESYEPLAPEDED